MSKKLAAVRPIYESERQRKRVSRNEFWRGVLCFWTWPFGHHWDERGDCAYCRNHWDELGSI